jgi:hypothetical protein
MIAVCYYPLQVRDPVHVEPWLSLMKIEAEALIWFSCVSPSLFKKVVFLQSVRTRVSCIES